MLRARARNRPLPADGSVPDWIELLPAGPDILGVDGRAWTLPDPSAVLAAFAVRNTPLVIDWEHATEHRAPVGLDAPAAGWVTALEARNGAIWGQVEWTAPAAQQIAARQYRYISPVFSYEKNSQRVVQLLSAGLTNTPNLNLTALNREQEPMDLTPITDALGLTAGADIAAIVAAINALKSEGESASASASTSAANRALPPLDTFIPRADYDAALARAVNAETRLTEIETAQREALIQSLIQSALRARQISPATQDYYTAMCKTADGIAQFKAFLAKAPALMGEGSGLDGKKPDAGGVALNAEWAAVSAQFGNSIDDLKQFGGLQ